MTIQPCSSCWISRISVSHETAADDYPRKNVPLRVNPFNHPMRAHFHTLFFLAILPVVLLSGCGDDEKPAKQRQSVNDTGPGFAPDVEPVQMQKSADGRVYLHKPSRTRFFVPIGWDVSKVHMKGSISFLDIRRKRDGREVSITWAPMERRLAQVADTYFETLQELHGKDYAQPPVQITLGRKRGWLIRLHETNDAGKPIMGLVYFFEAEVNPQYRWRVKLRARLEEGEKEQTIERLASSFQWSPEEPEPVFGPAPP